MNKRANTIPAMIIMSLILISTIFVYINQNSGNFISSNFLFDKTTDETMIYLSINDAFLSSLSDISSKGYSNQTTGWFENGPYPPSLDDFINYLNNEFKKRLILKLNKLKNSTNYKLNYSQMKITSEVDLENSMSYFSVKGIYLEREEENFYLKNELTFKLDFSNQIFIFNKFKEWNKNEGVWLLNNISNSFKAFCSNSCNCNAKPALDTNSETGLNRDWILEQVENKINILNTKYFLKTPIFCDYQILKENINENYNLNYNNAGMDSYCTFTSTNNIAHSEAMIWKEDSTIIDSNTFSYSHIPVANFLERDLDIDSNLLNIDSHSGIVSNTNKPLNTGNLNTVSLIETKEPGVALRIEIYCYDKQQSIQYQASNSNLIKSVFGYRINIFKKCNPTSSLIGYNTECSDGGYNCYSYYGCGLGSPTCVYDSSDHPPNPSYCPCNTFQDYYSCSQSGSFITTNYYCGNCSEIVVDDDGNDGGNNDGSGGGNDDGSGGGNNDGSGGGNNDGSGGGNDDGSGGGNNDGSGGGTSNGESTFDIFAFIRSQLSESENNYITVGSDSGLDTYTTSGGTTETGGIITYGNPPSDNYNPEYPSNPPDASK